MEKMTKEEQLAVVAGITCPLCGYSTSNVLAYSAHGWCHIADEVGIGTGN